MYPLAYHKNCWRVFFLFSLALLKLFTIFALIYGCIVEVVSSDTIFKGSLKHFLKPQHNSLLLGLRYFIMNWNNVICPACGLVNDYTVTEKSNNSVCTCNGCGKFLGNKPKDITGLRMPFGKYKHRLIKDVALLDLPYLSWFLRECHEKLSDNTIYALKYYLNIR